MRNNYIKGAMICLLSASLAFSVVGCDIQSKNQNDITYTTDIASSPQQYTMFINKEIEPITNHLVTQMGLADKVSRGEYPIADALTSVRAAIKMLDENIRMVDITLPPADYMELRENVLQGMVNAKDTLETYEDELQKSSIDKDNIEKLRNIMEGDYIVLTGLFNVYNE